MTRKNIRKHGGKFLGKGAYGSVYGEPRLVCKGETYEDIKDKSEISKVFRAINYANEENAVIGRLSVKIPPDQLDLLRKYSVLPIKQCIIDKTTINTPPYTTDEWKSNSIGIKDDVIFNDTEQLPVDTNEYTNMIIQSKGGDDLNTIFTNIDSDIKFQKCVIKLIGVAKAIQILQNHNFIHGDIKTINCLEHDGIFKLIDMTDCRDIITTTDAKYMPFAYGYFPWPSTCIYTHFFNITVPTSLTEINLTHEIIIDNYLGMEDYNNSMYTNYILPDLVYSYNISTMGFAPNEIIDLHNYRDKVYTQKTLGKKRVLYNGKYSQWITEENLNRFHQQLLMDIPGTTTDFIDEFNGYFQAFPTVEAAKLDIFKRIDIYSFGILILSCIHGYVSWKNTQPDKIIVPDIRELMLKLYKIAYDCCIQLDKCSDFNKIVKDYIDIIRPLISTLLPDLDPSIINPMPLLPPAPPILPPPPPPIVDISLLPPPVGPSQYILQQEYLQKQIQEEKKQKNLQKIMQIARENKITRKRKQTKKRQNKHQGKILVAKSF